MSIAENHGGLYKNLKELRDSDGNVNVIFLRQWDLITDMSLTEIILNH